jgi:hypothetical protein
MFAGRSERVGFQRIAATAAYRMLKARCRALACRRQSRRTFRPVRCEEGWSDFRDVPDGEPWHVEPDLPATNEERTGLPDTGGRHNVAALRRLKF